MPKLLVVDRVDIATSFNAHAATPAKSWLTVYGRDIDEAPGVELEGWLGAEGFQVQFRLGMRERDESFERRASGVNGHGRRVIVDDKTVVRIWCLWAESEVFVRRYALEWLDLSGRYAGVVCDLV
ncbi:hypothetical protein Tdes44962_MAKER05239 [Teratosphaeria destructans]|uniref:Uncharacterized protein n=1 Tax=Teratosphaeria destructans TaxID=418781 RepID=A0A9W7SKG2_9PEZI|nr:hypothetical protein Tdes44962_MAKER05239 [Teratosphaeria destructans]